MALYHFLLGISAYAVQLSEGRAEWCWNKVCSRLVRRSAIRIPRIRWYWFHLIGHTGFLVREAVVVTAENGWFGIVILSQISNWVVLLSVSRHVWKFAGVRRQAPATVDEILHMIILPANYCFLCALCVRMLKVNSDQRSLDVAMATLGSADIWEAWALWSVLKLFVLYVEPAMKQHSKTIRRNFTTKFKRTKTQPLVVRSSIAQQASQAAENTAELFLSVVSIFGNLSLMGVRSWVMTLTVLSSAEITVKGILVPRVPTLFFWLTDDCVGGSRWYDLHVAPVAEGIVFMMCSFALAFVVAFEHALSHDLEEIEPYWKFWGVKLVVSVTYMQWIAISSFSGLDSRDQYLCHCFLCCIEMPLLCVVHSWKAYPYNHPWVKAMLGNSAPRDRPWTLQAMSRRVFAGVVYYTIGVLLVLLIVPTDERAVVGHLVDLKCNRQDLVRLEGNQTYHFSAAASSPLPLCASQSMACARGYGGKPDVQCQADGTYSIDGGCQPIGCGAPPPQEHAWQDAGDESWVTGSRVSYTCNEGFQGDLVAECSASGQWLVQGSCTAEDCQHNCSSVGACGSLEVFLTRTVGAWRDVMETTGANVTSARSGKRVHLTCKQGYAGRPAATCEDGSWFLVDSCSFFRTSLECTCKARWTWCTGWWARTCWEDFGCASVAGGRSWCEVEPDSCPADDVHDLFGSVFAVSGKSSWDYCANDNYGIQWTPRRVPAGPVSLHRFLVVAVTGCALLALILVCLLLAFLAKTCFSRQGVLKEELKRNSAIGQRHYMPVAREPLLHHSSDVRAVSFRHGDCSSTSEDDEVEDIN